MINYSISASTLSQDTSIRLSLASSKVYSSANDEGESGLKRGVAFEQHSVGSEQESRGEGEEQRQKHSPLKGKKEIMNAAGERQLSRFLEGQQGTLDKCGRRTR